MSQIVGIDLGTTNSAIAYVDDGESEIIRTPQGNYTTPSVVQFRDDETLVGEPAYGTMITRSGQTVSHVKRHMGDDWESQEINGQTYRPEQVSALILEKLVEDAEEKLEEDIESAVITVPAYFGVAQREATKQAAEIADLDVERVINEPTAACLRYAQEAEDDLLEGEKETVFVYDLGGGTFDATLVEVGGEHVRVLGTGGDEQLGGEDFTNELYQHVKQAFLDAGNEIDDDPGIEANLREEAKELKENLSEVKSAEISIFMGGGFELEVTRNEFEELIDLLVEDTLSTVDDLFAHKNVDREKADVDRVLLVGGSTRVPLVQERVGDYFSLEPSRELDPDYVVAEGAAVQAANLDKDYEIDDTDNDDEDGADETELTDVISHTVGVEVFEEDSPNSLAPILEQNKEVPVTDKDVFTTTEDNQTTVEVRIFEGEDPIAEENTPLGEFRLSNLEPRPAGEPSIEVTFEVTEEGVIEATAVDKDLDKEATATVDVGLSQKEVTELKDEISNIPKVK